jgi:hypothetical protein
MKLCGSVFYVRFGDDRHKCNTWVDPQAGGALCGIMGINYPEKVQRVEDFLTPSSSSLPESVLSIGTPSVTLALSAPLSRRVRS